MILNRQPYTMACHPLQVQDDDMGRPSANSFFTKHGAAIHTILLQNLKTVQIIERDLDVVESCCEAASVFCVSCSLIEPVLLYWCGGMHWLR